MTAKGLAPADWLPNAIAIGRDTSLLLPSFFTPPFLAAPPAMPALAVQATVPLASLSESWLFGTPWTLRPADEDAGEEEDEEPWDGAANAILFAAVCASLARSDAGLLCSSSFNLDTGCDLRSHLHFTLISRRGS